MLDVVMHACNLSTLEAKAGGFQDQGQPELHSETLSQKEKKKKEKVLPVVPVQLISLRGK
jgi:hypothetical protein